VNRLVPLSEAIKQVAETLGMDEEAVAKLAAKAKAEGMLGNTALAAGSVVALGEATRRAVHVAAEAEKAGVHVDKGRLMWNGTDLTPYVKEVRLGSEVPHTAANRRTFYLLDKPYHYVQTSTGLRLLPGESPWN